MFWKVNLVMLTSMLSSYACAAQGIDLSKIRLPPGFEISVYADKVEGARSLTLSPSGTVFVGTKKQAKFTLSLITARRTEQTKQ